MPLKPAGKPVSTNLQFLQEGTNHIDQHLVQSVQFRMVLHKHTVNFLNAALLYPSNFSNKHYSNAAGVTINAVVRSSNKAMLHNQCLKPMIDADTDAQTRLDDIHFLTVNILPFKRLKK